VSVEESEERYLGACAFGGVTRVRGREQIEQMLLQTPETEMFTHIMLLFTNGGGATYCSWYGASGNQPGQFQKQVVP
jgi:hypothetical protein